MFGWEFFLVLEMLRTRKSSFRTVKNKKTRSNVYTVGIKVCTIYTVIIKINEIKKRDQS